MPRPRKMEGLSDTGKNIVDIAMLLTCRMTVQERFDTLLAANAEIMARALAEKERSRKNETMVSNHLKLIERGDNATLVAEGNEHDTEKAKDTET